MAVQLNQLSSVGVCASHTRLLMLQQQHRSSMRVEAMTALIRKSSLEVAKASSKQQKFPASMISHAVNIRSRMASPLTLSKHSIGNLWHQAVSPLEEVGLRDLADRVRKTITKVDGNYNYVAKLEGLKFF